MTQTQITVFHVSDDLNNIAVEGARLTARRPGEDACGHPDGSAKCQCE